MKTFYNVICRIIGLNKEKKTNSVRGLYDKQTATDSTVCGSWSVRLVINFVM